MKEYHTLSKLQAHLQRSASCSQRLWGRRRYYAPTHGCGSAVDQQLCQAHDGLLPPLRQAGPQLPESVPEAIPDHDLELAEKIYLRLTECTADDLVEQEVRQVIGTHPTSWHSCRATLAYLLEELSDQDIEVLDIGDIDIKHLLKYLTTTQAWPFLEDCPQRGGQRDLRGRLEALENQCLEASIAGGDRGPLWPVPRPMARERYLIHAFSGRRRLGDLQHFIDQAQKLHEATLLHTISVDLMVDPCWGDVAREDVRAFWLGAVRDRFVVGAFAGPPCG